VLRNKVYILSVGQPLIRLVLMKISPKANGFYCGWFGSQLRSIIPRLDVDGIVLASRGRRWKVSGKRRLRRSASSLSQCAVET